MIAYLVGMIVGAIAASIGYYINEHHFNNQKNNWIVNRALKKKQLTDYVAAHDFITYINKKYDMNAYIDIDNLNNGASINIFTYNGVVYANPSVTIRCLLKTEGKPEKYTAHISMHDVRMDNISTDVDTIGKIANKIEEAKEVKDELDGTEINKKELLSVIATEAL